MTNPATGKDGKTYKLTLKQEAACQALLELGIQSDAYRTAYDAENMTDKQIHEEACKLFAIPKVSQRVKELQEQARERHNVTVDSLTEQLQAAYDEAKNNGQSGAMVQATMGIAKLHGMLVDRTEDMTKAAEEMTPDERTAELARVQAELDALERPAGLKVSDGPTEH